MKRIIATPLFIFSCLPIFLFAQKELNDSSMVQKIIHEETSNSQINTIAHYFTDVSGPRLTNSPGYKRASLWAQQSLKSWGLQNASLEPWGEFGKGWSLEQCMVAIKKPYYKPLIALPKAWTNGTDGLVTADVILLDELDSSFIKKAGEKLKGKIVLIKAKDTLLRSAFINHTSRYTDSVLSKLPDNYMIRREMMSFYINYFIHQYRTEQYLKSAGAIALLSYNGSSRDGTIGVDGTQAYRSEFEPSLPLIVVSKEDYLEIQRLSMDGPAVQMEMNVQTKWYNNDTKGYNVVAEIPGMDPELKTQVVMLGAHLDSWHGATGATDNAAGCTVMMEAVRILKSLGVQPRRTIRIALWSGEEQGLLGSFGYVKKHFGDPANMRLKDEQKKISVYFNLDNGSGKIRGIYLQQNETARPIFTQWLAPFSSMGATGVTSSSTGSTDHISFDAIGIPAFQFIQDPLEYEIRTHHTNMDSYDHLQFSDLKQASMVVATFVYNAAMRNDMIPRKPLPKAERFIFDVDVPK